MSLHRPGRLPQKKSALPRFRCGRPEICESNVRKIDDHLASCAKDGSRVAVFPECALTGYFEDDFMRAITAEQLEEALQRVAASCRKHDIYAIIGTPMRDGDRLYNSAVVITPQGEILARYHKIQLAESWPTAGDELLVFKIDGVPASIIICHDERYPELVRLPVLAGARLVFCVSHESGLDKESKIVPYRAQIQARAVENSVYVVQANAPANTDSTGSHGQSRLIAPDGNLIKEASMFGEEMISATLDIEKATGHLAQQSIDRGPLGDWWRAGVAKVRFIKDGAPKLLELKLKPGELSWQISAWNKATGWLNLVLRVGSRLAIVWLLVCTLVFVVAAIACADADADNAPTVTLHLSIFDADVTPPLGHPLFGSVSPPAREIGERLSARGLVLLGCGEPIVIVAVDWLEIRNDAYRSWREALAEAANTRPERVLVSCVHQHDAPLADLTAQQLLADRQLAGKWIDPVFHRRAVQAVADALRAKLPLAQPVTHLGMGKALVRGVASNRRYLGPDGKPRHDRGSATTDPLMRLQPEGTIDPWLRTLSFWNGDRPLVALSAYATHPMSYYRTGRVSSDFPGIARERRQQETPNTLQIYFSGASGNVTAGKYNTGDPQNRMVLADRLYSAMREAWEATKRVPIEDVQFRSVPFTLAPRDEQGFQVADLEAKLVATQDCAKPVSRGAWAELATSALRWEKSSICPLSTSARPSFCCFQPKAMSSISFWPTNFGRATLYSWPAMVNAAPDTFRMKRHGVKRMRT